VSGFGYVHRQLHPSPGVIQFVAPSYTLPYPGGEFPAVLTRSNGSHSAATATFTDCNDNEYTVEWADGEDGEKTVPVDFEVDEELSQDCTLTLTDVTGASIGEQSTTELIIEDEILPGFIQFSGALYELNEADGSIEVIVERVGGSDGPASAFLAIADDAPALSVAPDYVEWADGESDEKLVTVTLEQEVDQDYTNELLLVDITGSSPGSPTAAELLIVDDPAGSLQFSSATGTVTAGSTYVATVQRVGGSDGAVSVDYATSNGTAVAGTDYTATGGTLNWAGGDATPKTFEVQTNPPAVSLSITDTAALRASTNNELVEHDGYIYVACWFDPELRTFDVEDSLALTSTIYTPTFNNAYKLGIPAATGDYLYIPSASGNFLRIYIADISDRSTPTGIIAWAGGDIGSTIDRTSCIISGDTLYVMCSTRGAVRSYDISARTNPVFLSEVRGPVPGTTMAGSRTAILSENYLYVRCDTPRSIAIIDVSDPGSMVYVQSIASVATSGFSQAVEGNTHFVVHRVSTSLRVTSRDITNPSGVISVLQAYVVPAGGQPSSGVDNCVVSDGYLYAITKPTGFSSAIAVFSVSNPSSIGFLGKTDLDPVVYQDARRMIKVAEKLYTTIDGVNPNFTLMELQINGIDSKTFINTLSDPTGGATLGSPIVQTVTIGPAA
jgi:hypothetical protein